MSQIKCHLAFPLPPVTRSQLFRILCVGEHLRLPFNGAPPLSPDRSTCPPCTPPKQKEGILLISPSPGPILINLLSE